MVSPISAARSFPTPGAARHGERAGTNLLARRFASSNALGARECSRRPLSATLRGGGRRLSLRRLPAARTSGASERAGASLGGPASRRGAGTSGGSCCAARAAPAPPGRRLGRRCPVARARVKLPGGERAGSAGGAQAGASAALGSSESAHAWPHRPFAAAARSQAAAPAGTGTRGLHSRSAATRTAGVGVSGLWNRSRDRRARLLFCVRDPLQIFRESRRTARGASRRKSL